MKSSELLSEKKEDKFLGIIAGSPNYSRSLFTKDRSSTYSRRYKAFAGNNDLRKKLSHEISEMEKYKNLGEQYSFTPLSLRDGRDFGFQNTNMQGGGFFLTIKKCEEKYSSPFDYALTAIGQKLEIISGLNLNQILSLSHAFKAHYIIYKYFTPVENPRDGDLVIYSKSLNDIGHAGIYRDSKPNWNSPKSGTIESKISPTDQYVFQHDIFFLPDSIGDLARFYKVKQPNFKPMKSLKLLGNLTANEMYEVVNNEYLKFKETKKNIEIRNKISTSWGITLLENFSEIKYIDYIYFIGACHNYALSRIAKTHIGNINYIRGKIIDENFTLTINPKKGDLVAYYSFGSHVHSGIYHSENIVESKWGDGPIFKHPIFYLDKIYGNEVKFYKLNEDLTQASFVERLRKEGAVSGPITQTFTEKEIKKETSSNLYL